MTEYPDLGVPHRCSVNSFCILNHNCRLWFCDICKKVTKVEMDGELHELFIRDETYNKHDYSEDTRKELI